MNGNKTEDTKRKFKQPPDSPLASYLAKRMECARLAAAVVHLGGLKTRFFAVPILLTVCLFPGIPASADGLTLAANAKTRYQIVVATNALPSESYAAAQLQLYLEKITGAKPPIVT